MRLCHTAVFLPGCWQIESNEEVVSQRSHYKKTCTSFQASNALSKHFIAASGFPNRLLRSLREMQLPNLCSTIRQEGPNESKSKMARNTTWQFCNETTLVFVWRHWLWLFLWMAKGALTRALHNSKLHRNSNVSDKSLQNLFPLNRSRKVWWRLVEFRVALPSSGNIAAACRTTALSFCFLWRALATAWDRDISKKKDYLPSPS